MVEDFWEEVVERCWWGLMLVDVVVKERRERDDVRVCKGWVVGERWERGSEVKEIRGRGRRILRELVEWRRCGEDGRWERFGVVLGEDVGEFRDLREGFMGEMMREGEIDFMGWMEELVKWRSGGDGECGGMLG